MRETVRVQLSGGGVLPRYASPGAAGADLCAAESVIVGPGERAAIGTGLEIELPPGTVGLVWPRSGLAVRHGVDTLAGVVDSDYRGEVKVVLINHGREPFHVLAGDRIAQLLVQRVEQVEFAAEADLTATARGAGGGGSGLTRRSGAAEAGISTPLTLHRAESVRFARLGGVSSRDSAA